MKMLYPKQSVYHHWLLVYQSNAERKVMEDDTHKNFGKI